MRRKQGRASVVFVWLFLVFCGLHPPFQQVHALTRVSPTRSQRFLSFAVLEQLQKLVNPTRPPHGTTTTARNDPDEKDPRPPLQQHDDPVSLHPSVGGLRGTSTEQQAKDDENAWNPVSHSTHGLKRQVMDLESGQLCDIVSDCVPCPSSEQQDHACQATGHRIEISCAQQAHHKQDNDKDDQHTTSTSTTTSNNNNNNNNTEEDVLKYVSCEPPEKPNRFVHVLTFEVLMGCILFVAYKALVREQKNHISSFDLRKDPTQRRNLLARNKERD